MTLVRRTAVAWDPTLTRVEYLDREGNPYYCCFKPRDQSQDTQPPSTDGALTSAPLSEAEGPVPNQGKAFVQMWARAAVRSVLHLQARCRGQLLRLLSLPRSW